MLLIAALLLRAASRARRHAYGDFADGVEDIFFSFSAASHATLRLWPFL